MTTGKTLTGVTEVAGMTLFGSMLGAMEADEKANFQKAWADYAEANGIIDIPPNLALVLCFATYAVPRAMSDEGKQRLVKMFVAAKNTIIPPKVSPL